MSAVRGWIFPFWTSLVLAGATLVLCRTPEGDGPPGQRTAVPGAVARVLTLPVFSTGPADLRGYVLAVGLAGLLLGYAIRGDGRRDRPGAARADTARRVDCGWRRWWFEWLAVVALAAAVGSAAWNDSWAYSRGWVLQLAVGCGWAAFMAAAANNAQAPRIIGGAMVAALVAAGLTLWHRQEVGLMYVRWPIGPVTASAALGAVWLAVATSTAAGLVGRGTERRASPGMMFVLSVATAAAALALLLIAARRGAWLGALAGVACVAGALVLRRVQGRRVWWGAGIAAGLAVALAAVWVYRQSVSPERRVAGPLAVRKAYWQAMLSDLPRWWLLGRGPDMFVCEITTALARPRAETPHVLHGAIDLAGHNEWLQAAYELGIVGGLAYGAMPVLAIVAALRNWRAGGRSKRDAALLASAAGLVAVLVVEASSINLRNPMLPAWYWTLLGLAVGLSRRGDGAAAGLPTWAPRPAVLRFAGGALAAALLLLVVDDARLGRAHAEGRALLGRDNAQAAGLLELAVERRGAANRLAAQSDLGIAQLEVARVMGGRTTTTESESWNAAAVETWRGLVERCRGYPGAAAGLAEALVVSGDHEAARAVLAEHLREVHPYDAVANRLYVQLAALSPAERLDHLCRALRESGVDAEDSNVAGQALGAKEAAATWARRVANAGDAVTLSATGEWGDALAPEVLRLEACRLGAEGDYAAAARLAALAAASYGRLAGDDAPRRRASAAEADAWMRAAEFAFRADPGAYEEAIGFIREAERYAVLGIAHEYLRGPAADDEFVGGRVVPTELPDALRPLWRLSALLRLAGGREAGLHLRLYSSLPAEQRTPRHVEALRRALARELVEAFASVPAARRPPHYARIAALASVGPVVPADGGPR